MEMLLPLLMAGLAAAGVLIVFSAVAGGRSMDPVQARLTQLGTMQARNLEEIELQQPLFDRTMRPMAQRLSGLSQRLTSPRKLVSTDKRLAMAGYPGGLRTNDFLGLKLAIALISAIVAFAVGLLQGDPAMGAFLVAPVGGLGFFLPEFWLSRRIKKRQHHILRAVPDTLDLLTISVRAGLSFDGALAKVVEKLKGPLSDEFRRALAEVRVGKQRRDALRDIIGRTEVPALSNFIGAIVQAEQLGVPIARVLQVQSEQLRIERRQRAEEMANKAPIKMLFPLVGCIFPSMFIVILGPAIIMIMRTFGDAGI
ncbi:MAG TPA: type II secretion system F family protein [Candidatus Limnocylindria bacterium]|nr:type II secretion system F family protein [Candidatus Limnocylindria bacterium]